MYIVALDGDAHAGERCARRLGGVARRAGAAEAVAASVGNFLLRHHAGDAQFPMPRAGHGLGAQDSAHLRAGDGEGVHLPRHIAPRGARLAQARAARTGGDVFHVRAGDAAAPFLPRRGRRQLHEVDRRAGAVGVAGGQQGILPGQGAAGALGSVFRDLRQFLTLQRAEEYLHAARAQGRGNVGGAARGGADEAKIGGQAVLKDVVDIGGRGLVSGVVIGAVEAHHAVFQHLEQLVHLHGVHLADLVEKKHAAVGARDRAFLGLRHAALPQRAGALIDGIVDAAEERVGDGALIKAQAGGVHLDKGRVRAKGRALRALGRLQRQPRRAGLAHARWAVDEDVLRVLAA